MITLIRQNVQGVWNTKIKLFADDGDCDFGERIILYPLRFRFPAPEPRGQVEPKSTSVVIF